MRGLLSKCRFCRFLGVGGLGFLVDAAILTILMWLGWGLVVSRATSFSLAVTVTWTLNRLWTFRLDESKKFGSRYWQYVAGQIIGAVVNLTVFFIIIGAVPSLSNKPIVPLAGGAIVAILFNYGFSRIVVFREIK